MFHVLRGRSQVVIEVKMPKYCFFFFSWWRKIAIKIYKLKKIKKKNSGTAICKLYWPHLFTWFAMKLLLWINIFSWSIKANLVLNLNTSWKYHLNFQKVDSVVILNYQNHECLYYGILIKKNEGKMRL